VGGIQPIETLYKGYRFRSREEARWAVFYDAAGISWRYEQEGYDLSAVELPYEPGGLEQAHGAYIRENPEAGNEKGIPRWYLPDFYLPKQKCWVEVKTRRPSRLEAEKMARLAWGKGENGYIFWDRRPPKEVQGSTSKNIVRNVLHSALGAEVLSEDTWLLTLSPGVDLEDRDLGPHILINHDYQWCECPQCGLLGNTYYGNAKLLKCGCLMKFSAERARLTYDIDLAGVYTDDSPRLMRAYMAARQARFEHGENPHQHVLKAKLDRIKEILNSDDIDED
jgi:hypothetical protein